MALNIEGLEYPEDYEWEVVNVKNTYMQIKLKLKNTENFDSFAVKIYTKL